ncbi:hypothetical protein [Cohnella yongneupensis]|uniref:Uncharacterized protein n=1 Tax=Cohnella yongneupensis TaxID=425006 RepID=A0ABW0R518_9BACL
MENDVIQRLTRFLVQSAREMCQNSDIQEKQIRVLQKELEILQAAHDESFSKIDEGFREEIFQLNGILELDEKGNRLHDRANDILSKFIYDGEPDLDSCLQAFYSELGLIHKDIE